MWCRSPVDRVTFGCSVRAEVAGCCGGRGKDSSAGFTAEVFESPRSRLASEFDHERMSGVEPIPMQFFDFRPCRESA